MTKQISLIVTVLLLTLSPGVSQAQSTTYGFDLFGSGGLFAMTPSTGGDFAGFFRPGIDESVYTCFAMDFNATGTLIFAIDDNSGTFGTIDPGSGAFTIIAPLTGDLDPSSTTATGLTVDPASGTVYVCTTDSLYTIDTASGATTLIAPFTPTGADVTDIVIDIAADNSGNLFIFDFDTTSVLDNGGLWSVDPVTAEVAFLGSAGIDFVSFAQGMDFDPATNTLYAAVFANDGTNSGGEYGTWDTTLGEFTPIAPLQATVDSEWEITISGGLAFVQNLLDGDSLASFPVTMPDGYSVFFRPPVATSYAMDWDASGSTLHAIDVSTGFPYSLGTLNTDTGEILRTFDLSGDYLTSGVSVPVGMTCDDSTGTFYMADISGLYELDVTTGNTTLIGSFDITNGVIVEIAASPTGVLYAADATTNALYEVNTTNASTTFVGGAGFDIGAFVQGMDFDPDDGRLYAAHFNTVAGVPAGRYGVWDTTIGNFTEILPLQSISDPDGDGLEIKIAVRFVPTVVDILPDSFDIVAGNSDGGGLPELQASDNADARVSRDQFSLQARVIYEVEATSSASDPAGMDFTIEESVFARGNVSRTVQMFNYDTGSYENVDIRNASRLGDRTDVINIPGDAARFVEDGTDRMLVRVRYDGPIPRAAFTCNVDHLFWTISN